MTLLAQSIIPTWAAVVLCVPTMLVLAAHVLSLQRVEMPSSRRRIRTVNGLLMLTLAPLLAYAAGVVGTGSGKAFALAWMSVLALVGMVVALALIDAANNVRLYRHARAELQREMAEERARAQRPGPEPGAKPAEGPGR